MPVATPGVPRPSVSVHGRPILRRVLMVSALASITVAIVGLLQAWPYVWLPCAIAGVLMLLDVRLMAITRRAPATPAAIVRRRVVAAIVVCIALIGLAIAASLFGESGWRLVGVAALVAFALMTLIAMPVLAAVSHDTARAADRAAQGADRTG